MSGIGVDLADIDRFRKILAQRKDAFLRNTFTSNEALYCRSYRDPAPHFAGTFAAKEAVRKISAEYHLPMKSLEIRRSGTGKPEVWVRGRRDASLFISITHGKRDAFAVALRHEPEKMRRRRPR